ncbi:MAG: hypothetical protein U5R48_14610 [Gammaproteobacteria bacterium]|nr:hypothetical protein [Gammaproteobacteria bacterium]
MPTDSRRRLLKGLLSLPLIGTGPLRVAFAAGPSATDARLVTVILRGGLDGLWVLPPRGDPDYGRIRAELGPGAPGGRNGALDLDGTFVLHPDLAGCTDAGRPASCCRCMPFVCILICAGCTDAGRPASCCRCMRWPRPIVAAPTSMPRTCSKSVRRAPTGPATAGSTGCCPAGARGGGAARSRGRGGGGDLGAAAAARPGAGGRLVHGRPAGSRRRTPWARLQALYAGDDFLGPRLEAALAADAMAGASDAGDDAIRGRREPGLAAGRGDACWPTRAIYKRIATLDFNGCPTGHSRPWISTAGTAMPPRTPCAGGCGCWIHALATLHEALGPARSRTVGDGGEPSSAGAVAPNGTGGTDHGTAGAAFLLGGAVRGGRVLADWPSLAPSALRDGRDLRPTLDLRAVFEGVPGDHLGVSQQQLSRSVFPDSGAVRPVRDLVRG